MKDFAQDFQKTYPQITVEEESEIWLDEDINGNQTEFEQITYNVTSIPGLENLTLNLTSKDEFKKLDDLIKAKPTIFSDFLGGRFANRVEVVLTKLSKGLFLPRPPARNVTIQILHNRNDVEIVLSSSRKESSSIGFIASKLVGVRIQNTRVIAVLNGINAATAQQLEADTRHVLRSALFDLEYTYGHSFETTNLENLKSAQTSTRGRTPRLPTESIRLMYKAYVPELIEYFHVAEKVDYLPFKYVCYFHVLEYFMDKSAYSVVSRKVKQILLSPDFHLRSTEHIASAVNIIKQETERNTTDKIKIGRVIGEFAQSDTIKAHLNSIQVLDHFNKDHLISCSKPLKLSAIKFDSEQSFTESVAKRIYAMRCSIVHSNPDFEESKAVPFLPTPKNIEFLRTEIELIKEISRIIICNSAT